MHISSSFILNGVCVRWRGWLDLERLDGSGLLELDEALMLREEANLQKHLHMVHQRLRDCEERYRSDADIQVCHMVKAEDPDQVDPMIFVWIFFLFSTKSGP